MKKINEKPHVVFINSRVSNTMHIVPFYFTVGHIKDPQPPYPGLSALTYLYRYVYPTSDCMYSLSRLSAISIKLGLNNEGNYFLEESRKFLYPSMTWRTLLFWPLSTQGPKFKNGHWSADIWFPSLPPAEYRWLWKALRSACDINSSFLNNWEPMDLLYNLHTLRVSQSPQEKRLMRGDEVGWFHTCVILFWKPNKEAWLNRINVVRKISVAGQNWERVNVLTLGASPVTGQEKMKRIISPIILNFLTWNFSSAGDFEARQSFS